MLDREAAIARLLWIADKDRAWLEEIGIPDASTMGAFLQDVAEMLREQEARVLTLNEVKRIGANNFGALNGEDLTILWVEEFGKNYGAEPVIAEWDEDDWNGEPNDIVCACYFDSAHDERFDLNEYNKTWRLWTDKPTDTQKMGVAWNA